MDREVLAELRAHTSTLNALRERQIDPRKEIRQIVAAMNVSLSQLIEPLGAEAQPQARKEFGADH